MSILGIDVGGTNLRIGFSSDDRRIIKFVCIPTPRTWMRGRQRIADVVHAWDVGPVRRMIIGLPGQLNARRSVVLHAGNLRGWERQPIVADLQKLFHTKVILENDAALAGLGEASFGRGRGYSIVAYVTVSTGVGGARIVDGHVDRQWVGFEPGHQIIASHQGRSQTLEDLVSGGNILRRFHRSPEKLTDQKIWRLLAHELAIGLVNVIDLWSPDVLILGGGVMARYRKELPYIRKIVSHHLPKHIRKPRILLHQLGDKAGIYGALALAKKI